MNDDELITLMKEPFADVHMTMPTDEVIRHGRTVRTRRRRLRGLTGAVALSGSAIAAVALLVPGGQATTGRPDPGGHPATPRLAAWIVNRDPDGGITVTVNQMTDPGGLQATLRADGIPARVTFDPVHAMTQPLPAGCTAPKMSDTANARLQGKILNPPAIWAYMQQERQRLQSLPLYVTYTMNGQVKHETLFRDSGGAMPVEKLRQLQKEGATNVTVTGPGVGYTLPSWLRTLQEKETDDAAGRSALYVNPAAIPAGIGLSIGVDVASENNFSFGVDLVVTSPQCTGS